MGARPILIVEDDEELRQVLIDHLTADPIFQPVEAATISEAQRQLAAAPEPFHLVILDITLPDGDGRDFCIAMRRHGYNMPVIILTGSVDSADVVLGLNAGANDYIAKPYRAKELLARIHAQLRLFDTSEAAVFTIGPYTFQPAAKLLVKRVGNLRIRLTEKEASILKFLYRARDRAIPRDVLLKEVWGYHTEASTHTLETHIYRLRQKLEADPADPRLLITTSSGYQLDLGTEIAVR